MVRGLHSDIHNIWNGFKTKIFNGEKQEFGAQVVKLVRGLREEDTIGRISGRTFIETMDYI